MEKVRCLGECSDRYRRDHSRERTRQYRQHFGSRPPLGSGRKRGWRSPSQLRLQRHLTRAGTFEPEQVGTLKAKTDKVKKNYPPCLSIRSRKAKPSTRAMRAAAGAIPRSASQRMSGRNSSRAKPAASSRRASPTKTARSAATGAARKDDGVAESRWPAAMTPRLAGKDDFMRCRSVAHCAFTRVRSETRAGTRAGCTDGQRSACKDSAAFRPPAGASEAPEGQENHLRNLC